MKDYAYGSVILCVCRASTALSESCIHVDLTHLHWEDKLLLAPTSSPSSAAAGETTSLVNWDLGVSLSSFSPFDGCLVISSLSLIITQMISCSKLDDGSEAPHDECFFAALADNGALFMWGDNSRFQVKSWSCCTDWPVLSTNISSMIMFGNCLLYWSCWKDYFVCSSVMGAANANLCQLQS